MKLILQGLLVASSLLSLMTLWGTRSRSGISQGQVCIFVLIAGGVASDTQYLNGSVGFRIAFFVTFLAAFLLRFRERQKAPASKRHFATAVIVLWAWLAVVDVTAAHIGRQEAMAPLTSLVTLLVCGFATSPRDITHRTVARTLLALVSVITLVGAMSPLSWRACDQFKCTPVGGFFAGPFPSENDMAMLALFTLAWSLLGLKGYLRGAGILMSVLLLVATVSRTSMLAAVICLALYGLALLGKKRPWAQQGPVSPFTSVAFGVSAVAVGVVLTKTADEEAFSTRGSIWMQAYTALSAHPVRGLGMHSWFDLQAVGLLPQHFAHSQYVFIIFSGGLVALALYAGVLALGLRHSTKGPGLLITGAIPIVAVAVAGMTEVAWNPFTLDGTSWPILVIMLATCEEGRRRLPARGDSSTTLRPARDRMRTRV